MERIITNYTASDRTIVLINAKALAAITIENVRSIINETQKKTDGKPIPPLVSSGYKQNITSVAYDSTHETVTITLASTVPAIASGDKLTIKVDMGESLPSEDTMKQLYSAHFERNDDDEDTYTLVLPLTATVDETGEGIVITI